MNRLIGAIIIAPVGALAAAFLGQYLFPACALDWEMIIGSDGITRGTGLRMPASALVFLLPSKISIPLVLVTYLTVLVVGAPLGVYLSKRNKFVWWLSCAIGALVGAGLYAAISSRYFLIDSAAGVQAYLYAAFIGASTASLYWLAAPKRPMYGG